MSRVLSAEVSPTGPVGGCPFGIPARLNESAADRIDGHGGARLIPGGGLAGLLERVQTVDGRLEVDSPPGGPTIVTIELPRHA